MRHEQPTEAVGHYSARPQPIPPYRRAPARLFRANLPRSRVKYVRVVSAMVAPRDHATLYSGSQRLTNEPKAFWQRSELFSSYENFSRDPSLIAMKSHARIHPESEAHNKVVEEGAAFTGRLWLVTLGGAWFSTNTRPAATSTWLWSRRVFACQSHRF